MLQAVTFMDAALPKRKSGSGPRGQKEWHADWPKLPMETKKLVLTNLERLDAVAHKELPGKSAPSRRKPPVSCIRSRTMARRRRNARGLW